MSRKLAVAVIKNALRAVGWPYMLGVIAEALNELIDEAGTSAWTVNHVVTARDVLRALAFSSFPG